MKIYKMQNENMIKTKIKETKKKEKIKKIRKESEQKLKLNKEIIC